MNAAGGFFFGQGFGKAQDEGFTGCINRKIRLRQIGSNGGHVHNHGTLVHPWQGPPAQVCQGGAV